MSGVGVLVLQRDGHPSLRRALALQELVTHAALETLQALTRAFLHTMHTRFWYIIYIFFFLVLFC